MALIDEDRYRALTHDTEPSFDDVEVALEDSQRALEEWLARPLEQQSVTEQLTIYGGYVYPGVTPIVSVPAGLKIEGNSISGVTVDPTHSFSILNWAAAVDYTALVTITYVGGFSAEDLPVSLQRAIAEGAQSLLQPVSSERPVGATSVRLGDAAVTYEDGSRTSVSGSLFSKSTLQGVRKWQRKFV